VNFNIDIKSLIMETITIEIVNPKAKQLITDLADMKLIIISKSTSKIADFRKIVTKLRSNSDYIPSLEEITKEVELVRAKRYAIKSK
jgi:precorrin-2 methylase